MAVMGESLRGLFDGLIAPERIAVVPNGTPELKGLRAKHDRRRGLFIGNLWRRKGVLEAVEAAVLVVQQAPEARFIFTGEWENIETEREAQAVAAAGDGRVEFRGKTIGAERDALLAESGFLLFPPVEPEGHPRVVLEALAAALPVITTDRGTIAETVIDGKSGFVLPDPVPVQLAARILSLLEDERLWERMSETARARYLERFTQTEADRRLCVWLRAVACGDGGERTAGQI